MPLLRKIGNVCCTVLVGITLCLAVFLMGSRLLGYRVFTVISGSMEPEYAVGDLIYVKDTDPADVQVGMPITFVLDKNLTVATHRVVEVDTQNRVFYTKGDTNNTVDPPVRFDNLIGVPQFSVPLLGYVAQAIQTPPGSYITIAAVALLVAVVFWPNGFKLRKAAGNTVSEEGGSDV